MHNNRALRKMPIESSNDLPHIALAVGKHDTGARISSLFDTGAALSTGYLPYHMFMKLKHPETVHSYEACDGSNPFDPITLTGAISNAPGYNVSKHGILSAVIRYFTPYKDNDGKRLLFCIALGNVMTVKSILGSTVIDQWELELKFKPREVISHKLRATFALEYTRTVRTHEPIAMQEQPTVNTAKAQGCNDPSDVTTSQVAALVAKAAGEDKASSSGVSASYAWG